MNTWGGLRDVHKRKPRIPAKAAPKKTPPHPRRRFHAHSPPHPPRHPINPLPKRIPRKSPLQIMPLHIQNPIPHRRPIKAKPLIKPLRPHRPPHPQKPPHRILRTLRHHTHIMCRLPNHKMRMPRLQRHRINGHPQPPAQRIHHRPPHRQQLFLRKQKLRIFHPLPIPLLDHRMRRKDNPLIHPPALIPTQPRPIRGHSKHDRQCRHARRVYQNLAPHDYMGGLRDVHQRTTVHPQTTLPHPVRGPTKTWGAYGAYTNDTTVHAPNDPHQAHSCPMKTQGAYGTCTDDTMVLMPNCISTNKASHFGRMEVGSLGPLRSSPAFSLATIVSQEVNRSKSIKCSDRTPPIATDSA